MTMTKTDWEWAVGIVVVAAGRRRAETNFSWSGVAKKPRALYRSLG